MGAERMTVASSLAHVVKLRAEAEVSRAQTNLIGSRNRFYLRFAWGLEPFWLKSVHLNDLFVPEIVYMDALQR